MPDHNAIAQALASIRGRMEAAAWKAGRNPAAITLVAVSKTHSADAVAEAIAAGQMVFGENRLQEAARKFTGILPGHPQAKLHLIGGLQTNKAKEAVKLCHMIESLDRLRLADAIGREAEAAGRCPDLLVQVNIGDEPQKSGIAPGDADAFIKAMRVRFGDALKGLMCIPPIAADSRPYFQRLASLADAHGLAVRSMGMSDDFETAIECGATQVRVGSAIFGARKYI